MDLNGHVIYAVDFDGTLSFGRYPDVGEPNVLLFGFLKREQQQGARLILHTCRTGDHLEAAIAFCREKGLEFEFVNENLPELIDLYGGDTRKINADFYIDDKAVNPIAGHFTVVPAGFNFIKKTEGGNRRCSENRIKDTIFEGYTEQSNRSTTQGRPAKRTS